VKLKGLRKLQLAGRTVSLWPRPRVEPDGQIATMRWHVRVDMKARTVELHAPSGHFFDATDVINHYRRHGDLLILDAQVVIRGNTIDLIPQPWSATARDLTRQIGVALGQSQTQRIGAALGARPPWVSPGVKIRLTFVDGAGDQIPQQMVAAQLQIRNGSQLDTLRRIWPKP